MLLIAWVRCWGCVLRVRRKADGTGWDLEGWGGGSGIDSIRAVVFGHVFSSLHTYTPQRSYCSSKGHGLCIMRTPIVPVCGCKCEIEEDTWVYIYLYFFLDLRSN